MKIILLNLSTFLHTSISILIHMRDDAELDIAAKQINAFRVFKVLFVGSQYMREIAL